MLVLFYYLGNAVFVWKFWMMIKYSGLKLGIVDSSLNG